MKIIKPSARIVTPVNTSDVYKHLERCGRVCYKSESRITEDSCIRFIQNLIKHGHEAVLEHFDITVNIVCDRGVSHEIVRHRLASYSQESTRYCNYSKGQFDGEITVIQPCFLEENSPGYFYWDAACRKAENAYFELLDWGCTPEQARAVLPNSLKTEMMMTANLREWRHFFKLRLASDAHPQMRELARLIYEQMFAVLPSIFKDCDPENASST